MPEQPLTYETPEQAIERIRQNYPNIVEMTLLDSYATSILTGILTRDIANQAPTSAVVKVAFEMADECLQERAKRIPAQLTK